METLYTSEAKELGSEASDVPILKDAAAQVDDELIRFIEETLKKQVSLSQLASSDSSYSRFCALEHSVQHFH